MIRLAAMVLGILGIVLTVKPFFRHANWFVRLGDFPRIQVLAVLLMSFVASAADFDSLSPVDYVLALAVLAAAVYQFYCIAPFTFLYPREIEDARAADEDETNLSLLIFNVLMENRKAECVRQLIGRYDPDVVLLAETDEWWSGELEPLGGRYPYRASHILANHYGMLLLSRLPLHDTEVQFVIQDDVPSIHTQVRLRSGDDVALHGVHPRPPVPEERGRSTERDGELLLVGKAVRDSDLPCIVAGDMNDAAWSRTTRLFKRVSGLLDPRVGRGFYNTFHARWRFFRLPLDHIYVSHHFRLIGLERIRESCGSDHFPVFVRLSYERDATAHQARPVADISETEEAQEIIVAAMRENRFRRISFKRLREKIAQLKQRIVKRRR